MVPLYLSEVAPPHARGALNICFQMATTIGILVAQIINYYTNQITRYDWGWRISLSIAAIPATILFIGGMLLPETPNSLVERGQMEEGRAVLQRVRGMGGALRSAPLTGNILKPRVCVQNTYPSVALTSTISRNVFSKLTLARSPTVPDCMQLMCLPSSRTSSRRLPRPRP